MDKVTRQVFTKAHEAHLNGFYRAVLDYPIPKSPQLLPVNRKEFRENFIEEELDEFRNASSIEDEADALVDLVIVALGGLIEMGIAPGAAIEEVTMRNSMKERGEKRGRDSGGGFDAMKPEGWVGPDYEALSTVTLADIQEIYDRKYKPKPTTGLMKPQVTAESLREELSEKPAEKAQAIAMKFNGHKTSMPELIPAPVIQALGELYAAGAQKYDAENWRKGRPWQDLVGSAERHFTDWRIGVRLDAESTASPKTHNLIAASWNLITLYMFEEHLKLHDLDNRPDVPKW